MKDSEIQSINPKGVINVYWSAFENSGDVRDFLKYKTANEGAKAIATGTNTGTGSESVQTGRFQ